MSKEKKKKIYAIASVEHCRLYILEPSEYSKVISPLVSKYSARCKSFKESEKDEATKWLQENYAEMTQGKKEVVKTYTETRRPITYDDIVKKKTKGAHKLNKSQNMPVGGGKAPKKRSGYSNTLPMSKPKEERKVKVDTTTLTPSQLDAFNSLIQGENIFLTGVAGTGKSFLVDMFVSWCSEKDRNVILCAPTGIAAINIGGVTIHKLIQSKGEQILSMRPKIIKELVLADTLIIDEISMCRIDLFDYIYSCLLLSNKVREDKGLKSTQVVVIGDFLQLAPVVTSQDREVLLSKYNQSIIYSGAFCFMSENWKNLNFNYIRLEETVRQQDKAFSDCLDRLRLGDTSALAWINQNCLKVRPANAIELNSLNEAVAMVNEREINLLNTRASQFKGKLIDNFKESDCPTDLALTIKPGCRVMSIINASDESYQNGSLGTVKKVTKNNNVLVEFDNGNSAEISAHKWEKKEYKVVLDAETGENKIIENVIGEFIQLPLKLAYAVTIHKSQGTTLDKVILNPHTFTAGQLYVALSRVKNIQDLYLTRPLRPEDLKSNQAVVNFEKSLNSSKQVQT